MRSGHLTGIIISSIVIVISCILLFGESHNYNNDKPLIVCTTSIIADTVKQISGDHFDIVTLMGPGVDPHIYRAREHDVHALSHATIIFYNGLHLEGKMAELLEQMNHYTTAIAVTDCIPAHQLIQSPEFETMYDPHVWFDIPIWIQITQSIGEHLSTIDPTHAHEYQSKTQRYVHKLEQTHEYVLSKVSSLKPDQRILITAHDAFGYFGRAYGFTVVGLQGISTESEISIKDIELLAHYIVKHKVPAIFVESSIPHRTLQAIHNAVAMQGWSITIDPELFSDALGAPNTLGGSYIGMIRHNCDSIVSGLARSIH